MLPPAHQPPAAMFINSSKLRARSGLYLASPTSSRSCRPPSTLEWPQRWVSLRASASAPKRSVMPRYAWIQQTTTVSCCILLYPVVSYTYPTCIQVYPTVCILGRIRVGQIHIKKFEDTFHFDCIPTYPDVSRRIPLHMTEYM